MKTSGTWSTPDDIHIYIYMYALVSYSIICEKNISCMCCILSLRFLEIWKHIYIYKHACMHACTNECMNECMNVCMYVYVYAYVYVCVCIYDTFVYVDIYF